MATGGSSPSTGRNNSATCTSVLLARHGLGVEVGDATVRVVPRLELAVRRSPVERVELLTPVAGRGVQRLVPVEIHEDLLDAPVVVVGCLARGELGVRPEAHVDVGGGGVQGVQRPRTPVTLFQ